MKKIKNIKENVTSDGLILPPKTKLEEMIEMGDEIERTWKPEEYIRDVHEFFSKACLNGDSKAHMFIDEEDWIAHGSPVWSYDDTFVEFLNATKKELVDNRIPEIKEKLKRWSSDELSGFQKSIEGFADKMKFEDSGEMDKIDKKFHEIMEWLLNHQLEAIKDYEKGKIKIYEKDVLDDEVRSEVMKVANKIASKKISGFKKQSNIIH